MREQEIILNRLLDKLENSKHLSAPGSSPRRVMLRVEKNELPEYSYEEAEIRDSYNEAARALETQHLVLLEWVKGRPLLSSLVLNLDQIMQCYAAIGRVHPQIRTEHISTLICSHLEGVKVPWIISWKEDFCREIMEDLKIPAFCKTDDTPLLDLLCAFREYDALPSSITMRAFSIKCFSDTKYFERNVRDLFLRIARKYDKALSLACEENGLGEKEQLAFLGIYARPEHYELAGNCIIYTRRGGVNVDASDPYGLAIPSTLVDSVKRIELKAINLVTFIENKTNYDEYLVSEKKLGELVIYHGGFLSPQKRKLFSLIASGISSATPIRFWADIDMGGFRMFQHLQMILPKLTPMRMSGEFVERFHEHGLTRSKEYLSSLRTQMENGEFPLFEEAIERILEYGVTIEQEAFLN